MSAARDDQWINLYAGIMEEVKIRIAAINFILGNPQMAVAPIRREMGFLQLRMICELVALGCLVAHGDIQATNSSDLRKAYAADLILGTLEQLHPNFYPIPHDQIMDGPHHFQLAKKLAPFMTKAELIHLIHKCGEALHRGSLKKLMKPNGPVQHNLPEVLDATNKLIKLLEFHHIDLVDGRYMICMLNNRDIGGRVRVSIGHPQPGAAYNPPA